MTNLRAPALRLGTLAAASTLAASLAWAQAAGTAPPAAPPDAAGTAQEGAELTEAFLSSPENIEAGKAVWQQQCRHCHGRSAYPGKAPKLKPRKYTPEFVFDRVTNGFRKMPAWKAVFSERQRMAVVAYVLSRDFSP